MPLQNIETVFSAARERLAGKKTYVVGILMILLGYFQDDPQLMLEGFGLITLRAGVAKTANGK